MRGSPCWCSERAHPSFRIVNTGRLALVRQTSNRRSRPNAMSQEHFGIIALILAILFFLGGLRISYETEAGAIGQVPVLI